MTVYVVHLSNQKLDLTDAGRFGRLEICLLGPQKHLETAVETLRSSLRRFGDDDFLLAVGSPVLIMVAGMLAEDSSPSGVVNVLQWQPDQRRYEKISFKLWSRENDRP